MTKSPTNNETTTLTQSEKTDFRDFLYAVSHDLRAPVRHINSFTKIIAEQNADTFDEKTKQYFTHLMSASDKLNEMFNGLLQLSRLNTRQSPFTEFRLEEAVTTVVRSDLNEKIDKSGAIITLSTLPTVTGDRAHLEMLFYELLDNAIKFVREDIQPNIEIKSNESDTHWNFEIVDNGIGLDEQFHETVFEIFKGIHQSEQYPGHKVGLTAARKIVDRHGGQIYLKTNESSGLTVHFSLCKNLGKQPTIDS